MKKRITLRGHHILCLMAFCGKGYSNELINKIKKLQDLVRDNPSLTVDIIEGPDDICISCPHLTAEISPACQKNGAGSESEIRQMDANVLNKLGIICPAKTSFKSALQSVKALSRKELSQLCSGCQWKETENCTEAILSFIRSFSIYLCIRPAAPEGSGK